MIPTLPNRGPDKRPNGCSDGPPRTRPSHVVGRRFGCLALGALLFVASPFSTAWAAPAADNVSIVRIGFLDLEREASYSGRIDNVQRETVRHLERRMPDVQFESLVMTSAELRDAVASRDVDYFLASSGFFIEARRVGASAMGTLVSPDFPNPNRCVAGVMLVKKERSDLTSIASLKGARAVSTHPLNFMSFVTNLGEIFYAGFDPDDFFRSIEFTNDNTEAVLRAVADGRADVGLLRSCTPEAVIARAPDLANRFKAISAEGLKPGSDACMRSTRAYPGWTFASISGADPRMTRRILEELLLIAPGDLANNYTFTVATDYGRIESLFRDLRLGPYAHLRSWTLERIWSAAWPFLMLAAGLFMAWVWHWHQLERRVAERTAELEAAHAEQREMVRKIDALQRSAVVSQLSSIFAHEMAQPLSSMDYLIHALGILVERGTPEKERALACLSELASEHRHAAEILSRVRGYAKRPVDRSERRDLAVIVADVLSEIRQGGRLRHPLDIAAPPAGALFAPCDEVEIKIVLFNLVRNADAAMTEAEEKGIELAGHMLLRAGRDAEGCAFLEVSNPGEHHDDAFFERLGALFASAKPEGLGLGIQICRSIAEAHAARLVYGKRAGGGVVARFTFPKESHTA